MWSFITDLFHLTMFSDSIHVVHNHFIPVYCEITLHCIDIPLVDGHLGCFYFRVIINNALTSICSSIHFVLTYASIYLEYKQEF